MIPRKSDRQTWTSPARGLWIVLALLLVAGSPFSAGYAQLFGGREEENEPRDLGIPKPVPRKIEVPRGQPVKFEIAAETGTTIGQVEFLVRELPRAGKVLAVDKTPGFFNRATVTYLPDPSIPVNVDSLGFVARYRGGRFSSIARVDITLTNEASEILVPSAVSFGKVRVGESVVKSIPVSNLGEKNFRQQLAVSAPFSLVSPADGLLNVPAQGKAQLSVRYTPQRTGPSQFFLYLSQDQAGTVQLTGEALAAYSIDTPQVVLALDAESSERSGVLTLTNHSKSPIILNARFSSRLSGAVKTEYILRPGKNDFPIVLSATDSAPIEGLIELSLGDGMPQTVRVSGGNVPARLMLEVPGEISGNVLNFGQVVAGTNADAGFQITNSGGTVAQLRYDLPSPFQFLTPPESSVAPQQTIKLHLGIFPKEANAGGVNEKLQVYLVGADQPAASMALLANVLSMQKPASILDQELPQATENGTTAQEPAATITGAASSNPYLTEETSGPDTAAPEVPVSSSEESAESPSAVLETIEPDAAPQKNTASAIVRSKPKVDPSLMRSSDWERGLTPAERRAQQSPSGFVGRPGVERDISLGIGRPEDLALESARSDQVKVLFTAPRNSDGFTFEIEMLISIVDFETGQTVHVWQPVRNAKFSRTDRMIRATIPDLPPVTSIEIRAVAINPQGQSSPASEPILVRTELPMDWTYIYLGLGILVLLAVGFFFFRLWRNRQSDIYQAQYVDL